MEYLKSHFNSLVSLELDFYKTVNTQLKCYLSNWDKLGSADRFLLKELLFVYLRNKLLIDNYNSNFSDDLRFGLSISLYEIPQQLIGRKLNSINKLVELYKSQLGNNWDDFLAYKANLNKNSIESLSLTYSIPEYLVNNYSQFIESKHLSKVSELLHTNSPKTVRTVKSDADTIDKTNIITSDLYNNSYYVFKNFDISNSSVFNNYDFFVQDDGSRYISNICNPKPGMKILDACAGAGGKSIALASLCSECQIIAFDKNKKKLDELMRRARVHNLDNIFTIKERELDKMKESFDLVLVDAPCTGSGTIRRFPEKKYTITEDLAESFSKKQFDILTNYSNFVKKEGKLVYSTCSFLFTENQGVINRFLKRGNFKPADINSDIYKTDLKKVLSADAHQINLLPLDYNGDAFYAATLRKS
jgi:16S rRNA (cytosine967-C5)-methyltransferase